MDSCRLPTTRNWQQLDLIQMTTDVAQITVHTISFSLGEYQDSDLN